MKKLYSRFVAVIAVTLLIAVTSAASANSNRPHSMFCESEPNGHTFNHVTVIERFWICVHERPYAAYCDPGEMYSPSFGGCITADTQLPGPDNSFTCPPTGIHRFPHPNNCYRFHFCNAGNHFSLSCARDLHFDVTINDCNFIDRAQCRRDVCPTNNPPSNIITLPSESECNRFKWCFRGELQTFECADGLHWNQAIQNCDLPEAADCQLVPEVTDPPPGGIVVECPDPEEGASALVPHPETCNLYFECIDGEPNLRHCLPGMLFDRELGTCLDASLVFCVL